MMHVNSIWQPQYNSQAVDTEIVIILVRYKILTVTLHQKFHLLFNLKHVFHWYPMCASINTLRWLVCLCVAVKYVTNVNIRQPQWFDT